MKLFIRHLVDNNVIYFALSLTLVFFLMLNIGNPGFDGSFEGLGIRENQFIKDHKLIDSIFSEDEKVIIEVIPHKNNLNELISDITQLENALQFRFDSISFRSILNTINLVYTNKQIKQKSIQDALIKFSKSKIFSDLISRDKKSFLMIVGIPDDDPSIVVPKIRESLSDLQSGGRYTFHTTSQFHVEDAINNTLFKDLMKIIISLLISFILIMLWAYRSVHSIVYLISVVLASLVIAFFVLTIMDVTFNLISLLVLPVVIVLSVADGIHLLTGMISEDNSIDIKQRIKTVYGKYFIPSMLTSLTTAVAFFSLAFNETKSVVELGVVTGISILISFILCYTISPFILKYLPEVKKSNREFLNISRYFMDRKKQFTYALLPIIIIAGILLPKVKFKNDFEIFLPLGSVAKMDHDHIKKAYYSQSILETVFEINGVDKKREILNILSDSITAISGVKLVLNSVSNMTVTSKYGIPINLNKFSEFRGRFERNEGRTQRMHIMVSDPNLIPSINKKVKNILELEAISNLRISSQALVFDYVNREVGRSLIKSLLVSLLFLGLVFFILTKSMIKTVIGLLANLVPLSIIVIIFVGFELNINIVTAVTSVVCIGLIVDDTIHAFYRRVIRNEPLGELSFGMLTTTIILVVGFGLFTLSSIKPIIIFGAISSVVFIVTLLSDFTLLLYLLDKYGKD